MTEQELEDVLKFLEETPAAVRQLSAELASGQLSWKPSATDFSALEQVCHLRDLEVEGYGVRIEKLLAEAQPFLPDFDGSRLARERDYNRQDFETAMEEFTSARANNLRTLRALSSGQLALSGVLEGVGPVTLGGLLLLMRGHDESHREELRQLKERLRGAAAGSASSV